MESAPEGNQEFGSGETTETPEAANVRSKRPESDLLNDVAEPQLHHKEPSLAKRCASGGLVGSSPGAVTLSLTRRDVSERRIQQCETCRNSKLCKERNRCGHCKTFCNRVSTTPSPLEDGETVHTIRPEEKREVTDLPPEPEKKEVILGSRFKEENQEVVIPRYYSVGSVNSGATMSLFSKIFNIPESFEKFIVLGKMKGSKEGQNFDDIIIIDLAQVFGSDKKTKVTLHQFENVDPGSVQLVNDLNKKLDEMFRKRMEQTGNTQLSIDEINGIIDEAMREVGNNVGATQKVESRCHDSDEDEEAVVPYDNGYGYGQRSKDQPQTNKPHTIHHDHGSDESSEEDIKEIKDTKDLKDIKNPPVIQDNFDVVGKKESENEKDPKHLEEDYVDDTEEGRSEIKTLKEIIKPKETVGEVAKETEVLNLPDISKPLPSSENQVNEPNFQGRTNDDENEVIGESQPSSAPEDLEKSVVKIVEDSLKAVSDGQNFMELPRMNENVQKSPNFDPDKDETPPAIMEEELNKLNQANTENVVKTLENPRNQESGTTLQASNQDPVPLPDPNIVGSRGNFLEDDYSQEKSVSFGSLVPAKEVPSSVIDSRMKKVFYVGDDINLPLKMFEDENGVMKLRVDTEALCNCKNKNCTKKHVEDRFTTTLRESTNDESNGLPELQVRFSGDNEDKLLDSFVDSLHNHGENSDVVKRSPKTENDDESKQRELENEIEKLSKDIEKYNEETKKLLNKGTAALFKDVEKKKDVDQMMTLASNLLSWVRDYAVRELDS